MNGDYSVLKIRGKNQLLLVVAAVDETAFINAVTGKAPTHVRH